MSNPAAGRQYDSVVGLVYLKCSTPGNAWALPAKTPSAFAADDKLKARQVDIRLCGMRSM